MDLHDLYTRYAADVHRFALYLSGNRALADDLTSETFLRAWSSASPIREATVKAYLFTIVRHLYLSEITRSSRRVDLPADLPAASPTQHDRLETETRLRDVWRALHQLPEMDRAALLLRMQDDMPYEQIAQVLRITVANAKVKVHRARMKLAMLVPGTVQP
jgi:RNA polymerase sigma-70 factor (ECF subfamily)